MRLQGAKKGEGPYIEIGNITEPLNAAISLGGELVVLGKKLASVDHAFISPGEGIDIKAKTANLKIGGVFKMPTAEVEIVLRAPDRETGEVYEPKVIIKGSTAKMLGSGLEIELEVHKDKQYAAAEVTSLFGLFEAQVTMEGTSNWKNPGFKVTGLVYGNIFNRLSDALEMAAADLVNATEAMVAGMNKEVHVFSQNLIQAKIDKDKILDDIDAAGDSARRELAKAKREVNRLKSKYNRCSKEVRLDPARSMYRGGGALDRA